MLTAVWFLLKQKQTDKAYPETAKFSFQNPPVCENPADEEKLRGVFLYFCGSLILYRKK